MPATLALQMQLQEGTLVSGTKTTYQLALDDDGHITWPPTLSNGRRMQDHSQKVWQSVLMVLADGPVEDRSGQAVGIMFTKTRSRYRKLFHASMDAPARQGFQVTVLQSMKLTGLIHLDNQTSAKRTYRIALAVDVDQLPADWFSYAASLEVQQRACRGSGSAASQRADA